MRRILFFGALLLGLSFCGEPGEGSWETPSAAGTDAASEEPCAGHGSPHGAHCHCEGGWAPIQGTCQEIDRLPVCGPGAPAGSSCRCEPASSECACPADTGVEFYVGLYYCEEALH